MTTIASLRLENQILEKELYNKHIIINNLTRNETRFRLRVAATILQQKIHKKEATRKRLNNRFSKQKYQYTIVEQEMLIISSHIMV